MIKETNILLESDNVGQLSDCDEETAFLILKKFLIDDKIYTRKQKIHKERQDKQFKYLDLFYILVPITEKMFNSLAVEDRKNAKYSLKADRWKYIHVSSIPKTFEMNKDFINRLDTDGAKEIYVSRQIIDLAFKEIKPYYNAIIKSYIQSDVRLSKGLRKFEKYINELSRQTKRNHLYKSIMALAYAIRTIEEKLNKHD